MIPVTWLASPYRNARDGRYPIRAEVKHRIVGTLPGARAAFGVAPGTTRNASTHFGIGYVNGRLTLDQYVDLSDMAWGNGDVRSPTWTRIIAGVNPNLYTVSTEHEDGGSANRGRVSDAVWALSMELSKLLRCGDVAKIRAAGIRVRLATTVSELAAMPIDTGSYIDHHQIAGPNKPYCFRRWLDDPGFVEGSPSRRDRLLAHLNAEDDMQYWKPVQEDWWTANGTKFWDGNGNEKQFTTRERVTSIAESADGLASLYRLLRYGNEILVAPRAGLTPIAGTRIPPPGSYGWPPAPKPEVVEVIKEVPTGITTEDVAAAVKAERERVALVESTVVRTRIRNS